MLAVYDAVRAARARAVAGEGPSLIEVKTYRMKGHAEHDMQAYVPEGEIAEWEEKDPVHRYERALVDGGHAEEADLARVRDEVAAHLDEEIEAAEASPLPDPRAGPRGSVRRTRRGPGHPGPLPQTEARHERGHSR